MNIGIIVYSKTGNTMSVLQQLAKKLSHAGHAVTIDEVRASQATPGSGQDIEFARIPDITGYDALVLGSPVHGFNLAKTMQEFLSRMDPLGGKPVALLITQFFPFPWLGGNRALRQLTQLCQDKQGQVRAGKIINWSHRRRIHMIQEAVAELSQSFSQ